MRTIKCAECGEDVVACDNSVYLDYPPVEWDGGHAQWTIMIMGQAGIGDPVCYATAGDPGVDGKAHTLHEHQPEGSVMR